MTPHLTSENVDKIFEECLASESNTNALVIEGVVHKYAFNQEYIDKNTQTITDMLLDLPDEFQATKGGGWTFLNACNTKTGKQWTGLHLQMEKLFALGIAAKKAKWLLPKDMWQILPGGMPYVVVNYMQINEGG